MSLVPDQRINKVKGILFDIDGTLYYQAPVRIIMGCLLVLMNVHNPKELRRKLKVVKHYRRVQEGLRSAGRSKGRANIIQLNLAAEKAGEPYVYVSGIIKEWFERRPLPFVRLFRRRGINMAFEYWHKRKLKLGVFSDYPVQDKLQVLGIADFIHVAVSAADPDVEGFKPHTTGFAVAAKKMGLQPSEILYVGDRPEVDGLGASGAGMRVIILNNPLKKNGNRNYPAADSFSELIEAIQ